jgi:hypothetical protein
MMEKPAPLIAAEFTVTAEEPVEVRVTDFVTAEFTATLPKLKEVALSVSCGLALVPVPLKETTILLLVAALLLIVNWPVTAPAVAGLKSSWSVNDCFGFSVFGKLPATREKPEPAMEVELIVTGEVPDDVSVAVLVSVEFTATLPKFKAVPPIVNCGDPVVVCGVNTISTQ